MPLKFVLILVRVLEHSTKSFKIIRQRVESVKNSTTCKLPEKRLLRFPVIFFHLFTEACFYRMWQTYFVFVSYLKKVFLPAFTILRWKAKEKEALVFGLHFPVA